MASAYVGTCLMPPAFGVLSEHLTIGLFPVYLLAILIVMVCTNEHANRVTGLCQKQQASRQRVS